jgi:hypothetical protein
MKIHSVLKSLQADTQTNMANMTCKLCNFLLQIHYNSNH